MIKRMISAAALIAAGTALASADTSGWTTVISNAEVPSTNNSLGNLGLTQDYSYADYNWCVSFTLNDISTTSSGGLSVFTTHEATGLDGNLYGLSILVNTGTGAINIASVQGTHLGTPNSTGGTFDPDGDSLDISLSWDAVEYTMTLTVSQEDGYVSNYTTTLELGEGAEHSEQFLQYASLTTDCTFWTNSATGNGTSITNINVQVAEVPEPSMFGVLAGLGALGLVATRRRRNRKA